MSDAWNGACGARREGDDWERFRSLLDEQNEWPADYTFKFIVPREQLALVERIFADDERKVRASSRGRYNSVTVVRVVASAQEVIDVYLETAGIQGIVSL
jgi:putative lipoic acid-binding regulatory protein